VLVADRAQPLEIADRRRSTPPEPVMGSTMRPATVEGS